MNAEAAQRTDPVCGASVNPLRARAVAIVAGERYYFCCVEHREQFAGDPGRFVAALRAPAVVVELAAGDSGPAAVSAPPAHVVRFEIGGMTGVEDVERVRRAVARVAGVVDVEIDLVTEVASLAITPETFDARALVEQVATAGFEAAPRSRSPEEDLAAGAARAGALGRRARRAAIAAGALALPCALAPGAWGVAAALLAALVAAALGAGLRLRRAPELQAAAAAALLAVGGVMEAPLLAAASVAVVAFILAARWLEARARGAAAAAIAALEPLPATAVRPGDRVRVSAPDLVPVDGVVRSGDAVIDESASGGAAEAARGPGDPVVAGTRLTRGRVVVEARRTGGDRALARLRAAVVELHASPAPLPRAARRAEKVFARAAAGAAALALLAQMLFAGRGLAAGLAAAAALLVALCPLAPALATPAALAIAGARAARRGIMFRNAEAVERAAGVSCVVVDKGTALAHGKRQVEGLATAAGADGRQVLALAAAAEQASEAPLARALRAYAAGQGVHVPPAEQASFTAGRGVSARVAGAQVAVGPRRMAEAEGADPAALDELAAALAPAGARRPSGIYVLVDGKLAGAIGVGEPARAGARAFVAALAERSVRVALLTGDEPAAAESLAADLGIGEVHAALGPDGKKRVIAELRARAGAVAVVGDGVDDAAALAAGDVGIALARGVGLDPAAAGVTVLRGDLEGVLDALALARRTALRMRLGLALAVAHAALATAAFTVLPLGAAAPFVACTTTLAVIAAIVAAAVVP